MTLASAILLGIIQGITEFLPVSSSAHLVIAQHFIPGFSQPGVLFDVLLHAGTLLAVIIYFRKQLIALTLNKALLLILGTIPAVIFGFLFSDWLEASFSDIKAIGLQLIITGAFIYFVDFAKERRKSITWVDALIMGVAQAIAIIPGISRSGATIFAGVFRGLNKKQVADFSFLLSIPAIAGAIVFEVVKHGLSDSISMTNYAGGFVAAFVFGFLSIGVLLKFLVSRNFKIFAIYCFLIGGLVFFI
jgi:undecaprenyl-diphosphatase